MNYEGPRDPSLLRIPPTCPTPAEAIGVASKLNLGNIIIISELKDGFIMLSGGGVTLAESVWMLERAKATLMREFLGGTKDGL